jgi:GntR family transcriptional regulator
MRKHEQIAADLRARIDSGEFQDGDRLPSESALMETYGVANMTVRQALATLQHEGRVVGRQGAGVFVRTFRPIRRHGSRRLSKQVWQAGQSMWDVDERGAPVTIDQASIERVPAADELATLLGVEPGTHLVERRRRYLVDGEPVQLASSFVPATLAEGTPIEQPDTGPGGVYARLADAGHAPARFTEELHSRMPTTDEAAALGLSPGMPVIRLTRVAVDDQGHPVEATLSTLAGWAYVLQYDFTA